MKVAHNDVHQLIGVMVNEGATGAILVTSGEFTRAAVEAATKQGHVQLVDGDDLRAMLGPLPEPLPAPTSGFTDSMTLKLGPHAKGAAAYIGERLLSAAEDRIRGGGQRSMASRSVGLTAKAFIFKTLFAVLAP